MSNQATPRRHLRRRIDQDFVPDDGHIRVQLRHAMQIGVLVTHLTADHLLDGNLQRDWLQRRRKDVMLVQSAAQSVELGGVIALQSDESPNLQQLCSPTSTVEVQMPDGRITGSRHFRFPLAVAADWGGAAAKAEPAVGASRLL